MPVSYKADIAGVSLKPQESRTVAEWLLGRRGTVDEAGWKSLVYERNELHIKGRSTLRRQSNLLRARLSMLDPSLLILIADGSFRETVQACLAAAIKHSRLLGDFMDLVLRRQLALGSREIGQYQWREFLDECRQRDPGMSLWTPNTSIRIRTSIFAILQEAGLLVRGRVFVIQIPQYEESVIKALESLNEQYCFKCMRYEP